MLVLTRSQVRDVDQRAASEYGMAGLVLMENAGRGSVDVLMSMGCRGPVAIVCGKGNNAGDGLVMARHLDLRGIPVKVLLMVSPGELAGDAAANHAIVRKSGLPIVDFSGGFEAGPFDAELAGSEWVVDALLGTGASGPPRPPLDEAIRRINACPARKLAVDLPSGLDCDTGIPAEPTIRADVTCTLVARKVGFDNPAAAPFCGAVHVIDIGVPRKLVADV
jgi:NAD(P)H-hydrate epimerase